MRRITGALIALGIGGALVGITGLLVLGIGYGLPLLPLSAVFLAAMLVPLIQLAALHPRVTVYERGLWVKPMLWRAHPDPAWDNQSRTKTSARRAGRRQTGAIVAVRRRRPDGGAGLAHASLRHRRAQPRRRRPDGGAGLAHASLRHRRAQPRGLPRTARRDQTRDASTRPTRRASYGESPPFPTSSNAC